MRAFIAIELPEEIKTQLARIQEQLKRAGADVKWVEPKNIHLTLKFLGEIDDSQFNKICAILDEVAKNNAAYRANINSLGAFPKINSPRVIWAGVGQGDNETKAIAKQVEEKIQKLGIPKEDRAFSSHITLARTRSNKNQQSLVSELNKLAEEFGGKGLNFEVRKITLFKSTLMPGAPIYEPLKEASLTTT